MLNDCMEAVVAVGMDTDHLAGTGEGAQAAVDDRKVAVLTEEEVARRLGAEVANLADEDDRMLLRVSVVGGADSS